MKNNMVVTFDAISENEAFSRIAVAAFMVPADPAMDDVSEIKTAVSEAVTNSIVHGYKGEKGKITMICCLSDNEVSIEIADKGCGIADTQLARTPMYTSASHAERTGMGFTIMEAFMDSVDVISKPGEGTVVKMKRRLN